MTGKRSHNDRRRWDPENDVDKGWAWLVLFADCFVAILSAMPYSSGIFNIIFLEVFGMSKQVTAWVTAVHCSLLHLTGPLSSYLDSRITSRWTLFLGGLVGAFGYFLTFFATNITFVFITYGLIAGLGLGLTYTPCISVVNVYFNKHRRLAYSVNMIAMAVGTVIIPPFITMCNDYFGWRGCMFMLSGLQLQMLVCGALVQSTRIPLETADMEVDVGASSSVAVAKLDTHNRAETDIVIGSDRDHANELHNLESKLLCEGKRPATVQTGCEKSNIPMHSLDDETGSILLNQSGVDIRQPITDNDGFTTDDSFTLRRNPGFILLSFILLCLFISCMIVYVHFPAFFVKQGTSKSAVSFQLTLMGVGNIFARIIGGVATNREIDPFLAFVASIGISSMVLLLCPLLSATFGGQMVFVTLFGLYSPWYFSMLPAVTIQMVGAKNLAPAWGAANMVGGVGVLVGPPFAGWLYDVTGTYVYSMYIAGGIYIVAVILAFMIPVASYVKPHPTQPPGSGVPCGRRESDA